jgi:hypothetical protein
LEPENSRRLFHITVPSEEMKERKWRARIFRERGCLGLFMSIELKNLKVKIYFNIE